MASRDNLRGVDSVETNKYQSARRECRREGAVEMIDTGTDHYFAGRLRPRGGNSRIFSRPSYGWESTNFSRP